MALGTEIALIKALGGGALPPITAADAGKVLTATNSGVWGAQEPIGKKFIVTLTPTAQDFSGTMDKTVAEIDAAYKAGQEIWFMFINGTQSHFIPVNHVSIGANSDYPKFDVSILMTAINALINISTNYSSGDSNYYYTTIYSLTPAT